MSRFARFAEDVDGLILVTQTADKARGATDPLDGLRRRSERKLQKALYRYWARQQAALDKAIRRARPALLAAQAEAQQQQASKAGPQITLDWDAEGRRLDAEIGGLLDDIAALAGTAVKQEVTHLGLSVAWDIWDAAAAERARAYRYTLVKQINESTQQQLGQLIGQWIENGEALPALTERIRKLIPTKPYPGLRDRAELIAQTETTRVYAESRVAGLREAGLHNIRWQTANDELVCVLICAPLHDQVGTVDGVVNPEDGQAYTPPAHPGCRCWLTADTDELDALAQAEPVDLEPPAEEAQPAVQGAESGLIYKPDEKAITAARSMALRQLEIGNVKEDEIIDRLKELGTHPLRIRRGARGSLDIVQSGRFKTQFETGTSGGTFAPDERYAAENIGLGYPKDIPVTERPIYGYVEGYAVMYGDVEFVLNDSLKARTTITVGDSMDRFMSSELAGTPILNPSLEGVDGAIKNILSPARLDRFLEEDYIEAQIQGGVKLEDVERVVFHSGALFDGHPTENFRETYDRLIEKGIKVELDVENF